MKERKIFIIFLFIISFVIYFVIPAFAFDWDKKRPYRDSWGNPYKYQENLWKDTDRDGVPNYYDYRDRDPNIWSPYQLSPSQRGRYRYR